MSSLRSHRFTDTEYGIVPRVYNQPNPQTNRAIPSDFNAIKQILDAELDASDLYTEVWMEGEEELIKKKRYRFKYKDYFKDSTPDQCYTAIIAYALDTEVAVSGRWLQLYRDFNRRFRKLTDYNSWETFPYKSLYYLLMLAKDHVKNSPGISRRLYRGIRNFHFSFPPQVGDYFYFDYFASCTTEHLTAQKFLGSEGTLVELAAGATVACGISAYSIYDEEEVLVYPSSKFQIILFERNGLKDRIVLEKV